MLATLCTRDMAALRLPATISNLTFMAYAGLADLHPALPHALLPPVNLCHLLQAQRRSLTSA
ncbi:hypothetical protein DAETH_37700 (plasmid) [Deinococcus aetherius]|uniref:Uncharacterized protein n=1 Tax=Deinococcus aetherius TaxID=200252 RepID=A0ABM8AJ01_9DEIO|nr:hypothetical protein [Deinococcus aetherius]BDP43801.1 hypothetical protein DAETH_37700 [Deinococcus aetherius]